MSTLARALAIGDTQALLDTALGVAPPFAVKIDSELLQVGGIDYRFGTTLALKYPATAAHAASATVTSVLDAYTEDNSSPFASGGGGALTSVTIDLTAEQIATLNSVPVEVVAAPGAGKVIVPVGASFQYKAGAERFGLVASLILMLDSAQVAESEVVGFDDVTSMVASLPMAPANEDSWAHAQSVVDDLPLLLSGDPDPGFTGSILTASLADPGTGYAPGDTGTIGAGGATYEVDTVGGGGEVATFTVTAAGTGYGVEAGVTTAVVTGAGDGAFTVDIDTITPLSDGTARLTVLYYVMDLLV